MKEEILKILGKNHTNTIEFISVKNYNEVRGLYTYRNDVFVLKGGMDISFDDLTEKEQKTVCNMVVIKDWKINKSLQ